MDKGVENEISHERSKIYTHPKLKQVSLQLTLLRLKAVPLGAQPVSLHFQTYVTINNSHSSRQMTKCDSESCGSIRTRDPVLQLSHFALQGVPCRREHRRIVRLLREFRPGRLCGPLRKHNGFEHRPIWHKNH